MNSLLSFLPADGWPRLLCDALWQSTLIAAVGGLTARFLVRQAAACSWVLLLTLTGCLMVPLASLAMRAAGVGLLTAQADASPQAQGLRAPSSRWSLGLKLASDAPRAEPQTANSDGITNDFPESDLQLTTDAAGQDLRTLHAQLPLPFPSAGRLGLAVAREGRGEGAVTFGWLWPLVAFAWLGASAVLLLRLALSLVATRRLLKYAKPDEDPEILAAVAEASRRVGLLKTPLVLHSDKVTTPMVWALGHSAC